MFLGENVIANVFSFSNKFQDIPYIISATRNKYNLKIRCNCPSFTRRKIVECKHITELKKSSENNTINNDDRFVISDFGKIILNLK